MQAFEVQLNGRKLCLAGVGNYGVLSAIVSWVSGKRGSDCFLQVGGLISPTQEYVDWVRHHPVKEGDKIQVSVLVADSVDEPARRKLDDPGQDLEARKAHVRKLAKQLGWTIQQDSKKRSAKKKRRK